MSVDRLSVTVPSELGAALRALARQRGDTVSTVVTEAIAQQIRLAALDVAITEADRRFGRVPEEMVSEAEAQLVAASRRAKKRSRSRRRRR
jgi:predicted transcriptional regulator